MIECWAGAHTLLSARRARRSSMVGKIHVDTLKTIFFCPIPLDKPRSKYPNNYWGWSLYSATLASLYRFDTAQIKEKPCRKKSGQ